MSFWPFFRKREQVHLSRPLAVDGVYRCSWPEVQGRDTSANDQERFSQWWVDNPQDWICLSGSAGVRRDGTLWRVENSGEAGEYRPYVAQIGSDSGWTFATSASGTVFAMKGQSLYSFGSNARGLLGIGLDPIDSECGQYVGNAYRARLSTGVKSVGDLVAGVEENWFSVRPTLSVQARICDRTGGGVMSARNGYGAAVSFDWLAEVESISVTASGAGYTSAPTVTLLSSTNSKNENEAGATATVTEMVKVSVSSFTVAAAGAGYTSATATESLTGATATAIIDSGKISSWTITNHGSPIDPLRKSQLSVSVSGDGTGARASAVLPPSGIATVTIDSNPSCWQSPPLIQFSGGGGSGATASALIRGKPTNLSVSSSGSGYTQTPWAYDAISERVFVVATASPSDRYASQWTSGGLALPYAEVNLIPGPVTTVEKSTQEMFSSPEIYASLTAEGRYGRYHTLQNSGKILPFEVRFSLPTGLPAGQNPPTHVAAYLVGPGVRKQPLTLLSSPSPGVYIFANTSTLTGYSHAPLISVEYSPPLHGSCKKYERVLEKDGINYSYVELIADAGVYLAGSTYTVTGDTYGATSTYAIINGEPLLKERTYARIYGAVQNQDVPSDVFPPRVSGKYFCNRAAPHGFRPLGASGTGFDNDMPWIRPSINQRTFFRFDPPQSGPGTAASAEAAVPATYGPGWVGVGSISLIDGGSGYAEEPVARVFTNYYDFPIQIPGNWLKVACIGQSAAAINSSGQLHWWGSETSDRLADYLFGPEKGLTFSHGESPPGWTGRTGPQTSGQITILGGHTCSPTPVGRGVVFESSSSWGGQTNFGEGGDFEVSMPDHGGARASFSLTPGVPLYVDSQLRAYDVYSRHLVSTDSCGLGYVSPPIVTQMQPASLAITARLCGPQSFSDVVSSLSGVFYAKGDDARWYVVSPYTVRPEAFPLIATSSTQQAQQVEIAQGVFITKQIMQATITAEAVDGVVRGAITQAGVGYSTATMSRTGGTKRTSDGSSISSESLPSNTYSLFVREDGSLSGGEIWSSQVDPASLPTVSLSGNGTGAAASVFFQYNLLPTDDPLPMLPHCVDSVDGSNVDDSIIVTGGGGAARSVTSGRFVKRDELSLLTSVRHHMGRKDSSGSLWATDEMEVIGPISIETTACGNGYYAPASANISQVDSSIATFDTQFSGRVVGIGVIDPGSDYTQPPAITITGGGGGGAAAQAVIAGEVSSVTVTAGGTGYRYPPDVSFSQPGISAKATAEVANGSVVAVTISDGGRYRSPPQVVFTPVQDVQAIAVTDPGGGFTSIPEVVIAGGGGDGAKATCTIAGPVKKVIVTSGGSGYETAPYVYIDGAGGKGATAAAVLSGGSVSAVTVTNGGSGFTSPPQVTFSGGGGSGAAATTVLDGRISSVTVTDRGHHYSSPPTVLFVGGGGGYAQAAASLAAPGGGASATTAIRGSIVCVNMTSNGSGYQYDPVVKVEGNARLGARISGTLTGITVTNGGDHYSQSRQTPNTVGGEIPSRVYVYDPTFTDPNNMKKQVGTGVTAGVSRMGDPITSVTLNQQAADYEFYRKPIAYASNSYAVVPKTVLTYAAVAMEKISDYAVASPVTRGDSAKAASQSLFSIGVDSAGIRTDSVDPDHTTFVADVVSPRGQLAKFTTSLDESWTDSIGGYYSIPPTVIVEDETGSGAVVSLVPRTNQEYVSGSTNQQASPVFGSVAAITSPGSGYTLRSRISFRGGTPLVWTQGNAASGSAAIAGGVVVSVNVANPGAGYYRDPLVYVVGGGGSGAVVSAVLGSNGTVASFVVEQGGSGYTSQPVIVVVDQEREIHRLEGYEAAMTDLAEHTFAWLANWSVEYVGAAYRRQRTLTGHRSVVIPYGDRSGSGILYTVSGNSKTWRAKLHPVFDDDGYVEHVIAKTFDYTLRKTYQGASQPFISFTPAGTTSTPASASAWPLRWSEVYGPPTLRLE